MADETDFQVCAVDPASCYDPQAMVCRLPAHNSREAADFLEVLGTGGALGTGYKAGKLGVDLPKIRTEYEQQVDQLIGEIELRRGTMPIEDLARWASAERLSIARGMRIRQGVGSVVLLEARDNIKYGFGGRTFPNLRNRYIRRGFRGDGVYEQVLKGAGSPNVELSAAAMRGAKYLRYGGKALVVVSVVTTGYTLLTTPSADLPRVMTEEAGGFFGGAVGSEVGIGLCLVLGIVTGGWGLLACGVIGGIGGGLLGTALGDRLYYSASDDVVTQADDDALIDFSLMSQTMPQMCY